MSILKEPTFKPTNFPLAQEIEKDFKSQSTKNPQLSYLYIGKIIEKLIKRSVFRAERKKAEQKNANKEIQNFLVTLDNMHSLQSLMFQIPVSISVGCSKQEIQPEAMTSDSHMATKVKTLQGPILLKSPPLISPKTLFRNRKNSNSSSQIYGKITDPNKTQKNLKQMSSHNSGENNLKLNTPDSIHLKAVNFRKVEPIFIPSGESLNDSQTRQLCKQDSFGKNVESDKHKFKINSSNSHLAKLYIKSPILSSLQMDPIELPLFGSKLVSQIPIREIFLASK